MSYCFYFISVYWEVVCVFVVIGCCIYGQGWLLVISSNYLLCFNEDYVVIICFGCDKGLLEEIDIMVVNMEGVVVGDGKLFVEILLYIQLYCCLLDCGVVLYIYSYVFMVLIMYWFVDYIILEGYELFKVLDGV